MLCGKGWIVALAKVLPFVALNGGWNRQRWSEIIKGLVVAYFFC